MQSLHLENSMRLLRRRLHSCTLLLEVCCLKKASNDNNGEVELVIRSRSMPEPLPCATSPRPHSVHKFHGSCNAACLSFLSLMLKGAPATKIAAIISILQVWTTEISTPGFKIFMHPAGEDPWPDVLNLYGFRPSLCESSHGSACAL